MTSAGNGLADFRLMRPGTDGSTAIAPPGADDGCVVLAVPTPAVNYDVNAILVAVIALLLLGGIFLVAMTRSAMRVADAAIEAAKLAMNLQEEDEDPEPDPEAVDDDAGGGDPDQLVMPMDPLVIPLRREGKGR